MIPKRIDRIENSSFERLGHYVLEANHEDSLILWTQTAEYIVDMEGEGEKVLWYRLSNVEADVPAMAIAEILTTQAENTRSQADKTYHMVISFPEGEIPTKAQMEDIEDRMCQELGYGEHQRLSAVHKNTDNIHLHVAINKVHPETHNVHMPHWDFYTMDRVCAELERKHGLTIDNRIGQGQGKGRGFDIEAHHGMPSFISWAQKNVRDQLLHVAENGRNWQDFHAVLGEYGLHIREKGAGFVIGVDGSKRAAKASSIDRKLSIKALTERFGELEPSQVQVEPKQQYQEAKHHDPGTKALYEAFQAYQNESKQKRAAFKEERDKAFKEYQVELKQWAAQAREQIKTSNSPAQHKRTAYSQIAKDRQRAFDEYKRVEADRKSVFYAEKPVLNWEQYLMRAAEQGDIVALARLRNKDHKKQQFSKLFLAADNLEAAKDVVRSTLKPFARKNGDLVYKVKDGGSVTDEKHRVVVDEHTVASVFLALSIASERFEGQPLDVTGTDEFKLEVVQLSGKYELDITFKAPDLDEKRQKLLQEKSRKNEEVAKELPPALEAYLFQRNQTRENVENILPHRLWDTKDAGTVIYEGRRNLTDGSEVILYKKNNEMLVKPVGSKEEGQGLKPGQTVRLTQQGIPEQSKGRGR